MKKFLRTIFAVILVITAVAVLGSCDNTNGGIGGKKDKWIALSDVENATITAYSVFEDTYIDTGRSFWQVDLKNPYESAANIVAPLNNYSSIQYFFNYGNDNDN